MRFAKAGDIWRNLYKKQFLTKLHSLEFTNILGLGSGKLTFSGGITVICGANGVGKTTLLNALMLSVKAVTDPVPYNIRTRFTSSELSVNVFEDGNIKVYTKVGATEDKGINAEIGYIESSSRSAKLIDFFSSMTNKDELLDGIDSTQYDKDEIELISYVTGKNYTSCDVYEIDDFDYNLIAGFEDVIPYFKVVDNGIEYGLEMMGLGELAAHLLIWSIKRAAKDSIFFLEEPESFISPKAQINLMNYIADMSLKKGIWLIITTHSMGIVSNIPLNHVKILSKNSSGISIIENPSQFQLNMILGVSFSYTGILFVEDLASKVFARAILDHFDGDISRRFDVVKAGSASAISSILYTFPKTSKNWLRTIGLYDGDVWHEQKSVIDTKRVKSDYLFLPTSLAPEVLLRNFFKSNTYDLESKLMISKDDLVFGLNSLEGCNHHDWPKDLANYLDVDEENMLRNMFRVWLEIPENETLASSTFEKIKQAFSA